MPPTNRFRHQAFAAAPSLCEHLRPGQQPALGSEFFRQRMRQVGNALRESGVAGIYLVHGTFLGPEALDTWTTAVPGSTTSGTANELGNYTAQYARLFEQSLAAAIPVRLFEWSSENHHLGRADGAVRLAAELASLDLRPDQRVLLWGHSHGGNVFALLTNLLGADGESLERFFNAARVYYRWPLLGWIDIPLWEGVRTALVDHERGVDSPVDHLAIDVATFGTPVCYGWDTNGYRRLVHFVNERAAGQVAAKAGQTSSSRALAHERVVPGAWKRGATDVQPSIFSWRSRLAEQRLHHLLDPRDDQATEVEDRTRLSDEGATVSVDYAAELASGAETSTGDGIFTEPAWMLFHAEEIARRFYGMSR